MKTKTALYTAAAVAGVVAAIFLARKVTAGAKSVGEAAGKVAQAINPVSDQNLAYRGVNAVTQTLTGDSSTSFGSWLYDVTHPNDPKANAPTPLTPKFTPISIDIGNYESTATQDDYDAGLGRFGVRPGYTAGWTSIYDLQGPVLP